MARPLSKKHATPLWSIKDVEFSYGRMNVLHDINLELLPGRCYGILGPNGSGKTTLLDLLAGVVSPAKGSISFLGRPLSRWPRKRLARVLGLVPQDFTVRFGFTVRETVEMGLHPHLHRFGSPSSDDFLRVDQALEETGMTGLADRSILRLSGGEKQRVAVARALAQAPEVMLLDEATSNLDIHHSLEILQLIRNRFELGDVHVVAVLHDLNLAAFFCDELIFLKKGRIVHQGPVDSTLTSNVIADVYNVEAQVAFNEFTNCRQVSFRLPGEMQ